MQMGRLLVAVPAHASGGLIAFPAGHAFRLATSLPCRPDRHRPECRGLLRPACTATSSSTTSRTSSRSRACASKPSLGLAARGTRQRAGRPLRAAGRPAELRAQPLLQRRLRALRLQGDQPRHPCRCRHPGFPSRPAPAGGGRAAACAGAGASRCRSHGGRLAAAPPPADDGAVCRAAHERPVGAVPLRGAAAARARARGRRDGRRGAGGRGLEPALSCPS